MSKWATVILILTACQKKDYASVPSAPSHIVDPPSISQIFQVCDQNILSTMGLAFWISPETGQIEQLTESETYVIGGGCNGWGGTCRPDCRYVILQGIPKLAD